MRLVGTYVKAGKFIHELITQNIIRICCDVV